MAGKKGQKKRFWSDEERVSIYAQTCAREVSVAQVARRYAMNTNLIHKWLRDPKFAPGYKITEDEIAETLCFLWRLWTGPAQRNSPDAGRQTRTQRH